VKKLIKAIALCLIFATQVTAQSTLTSSRLITTKKDTNRVLALNTIAEQYKYTHPDSARYFAKQGLRLSADLNYNYGIGILSRVSGELAMNQGKVEDARNLFIIALGAFKKIGDRKGIASIYNALGLLTGRQGNYKEATPFFLKALTTFEATKDTSGVIQSYIKLGSVNLETGRLDKALDYYHKGLALSVIFRSANTVETLLNNIGLVYVKKGDHQAALDYFKKGLQTITTSPRVDVHISLLINAGEAKSKLGDWKAAVSYANEALSLARQRHFRDQEASTLVILSSLLQKRKPDTSEILLHQALAINKGINQKYAMLDVYQGMVELYKQEGRYKEAEHILESKNILKDSLFSLKQAKEIAGMQSSYDLSKSAVKVEELNRSNQTIKGYRNIILAVAIGVFISLIFVLLLYRKTRKLNTELIEQKEILYQQKDELDRENNFKDKLFSIIGHDLRSPIATIVNLMEVSEEHLLSAEEFQSFVPQLKEQSKVTLETLDKLLMWGKTKLKGHRIDKTLFNVKELISKNIALYKNAALAKNISVDDHTPDELLIFADNTQVDFIIRNLLSNAIKFTHSGGKIEVAGKQEALQGFNTIIIKDNGIGIARESQQHIFERDNLSIDGTAQEKGNSIGLMLCKEFVEENKGRIELQSEPAQGTQCSVYLPYQ
jgi:signal transduction histidine kinase